MKELDILYRTMVAELEQRASDAAFQSDFPTDGWFVTVPVKNREYLSFETERGGEAKRCREALIDGLETIGEDVDPGDIFHVPDPAPSDRRR